VRHAHVSGDVAHEHGEDVPTWPRRRHRACGREKSPTEKVTC
jgi:hypothetical protein